MTIVFVAPFMASMLRGIERLVFEVGTRLAARGHRVHIIYWPGPDPWPYGPPGANLFPHQMPLGRYYQRYLAGMLYPLYFRRLKPDVVTFFYSWQGEDIACALDTLWDAARAACVLSVQYPVEQVPHRYATLAASRLVRRARALVACSDYVADGVRACLGRNPTVITNGVATDHFLPADAATRAAARRELGVPDDCTVYCTVAALEERKGVGRALEALALLKARGKRFRYLVVGDGPFRPRIDGLIAAHDLHEEVRLVGVQADLRPFYHACDVLLFLSHGEGAPLAPLEAMSSALPIVAADQPPLPAFLPARGTIFVEDTAPAAVLGALEVLAADPARMLAMGAFNRAYAVRHYAWETVADNYERLYRSITP